MKTMLVMMILCAATMQQANAEPSPEQFANDAALVSYWQSQPPIIRTQIFIDGHKAVDRAGTLPGFFMEQYFRCSTTHDLRRTCGSGEDASARLKHLVSLYPEVTIIDDEQGVVQLGDFTQVYIVTCTGDESVAGPVRFKWVAFIDLGFIPPPEDAIRPCP